MRKQSKGIIKIDQATSHRFQTFKLFRLFTFEKKVMNVCLVSLLQRQRVVVQDTRIQVQRNQTATQTQHLNLTTNILDATTIKSATGEKILLKKDFCYIKRQ